MKEHIRTLVTKASKAANADEAMKFAQAALNAANPMCALGSARPPYDEAEK